MRRLVAAALDDDRLAAEACEDVLLVREQRQPPCDRAQQEIAWAARGAAPSWMAKLAAPTAKTWSPIFTVAVSPPASARS